MLCCVTTAYKIPHFFSSCLVFVTVATFLLSQGITQTQACEDPLNDGILKVFECGSRGDSECLAEIYSPDFTRYDNGENLNPNVGATRISAPYWNGVWKIVSTTYNISTQEVVPGMDNTAYVEYVETWTFTDGSNFGLEPSNVYPFGQVLTQTEKAYSTVDDECRQLLWNQTVDMAEINATDQVFIALLGVPEIASDPIIACAFFGGNCEDEIESPDGSNNTPESTEAPSDQPSSAETKSSLASFFMVVSVLFFACLPI